MSTAAEKIKNFFKKKKNEAKFKVSCLFSQLRCLIFFTDFLIYFTFFVVVIFSQMAGPGRRLDSSENQAAGSSKSTKSSDAYVPPKRTELTSEARFIAFLLISIQFAKNQLTQI